MLVMNVPSVVELSGEVPKGGRDIFIVRCEGPYLEVYRYRRYP